MRDWLPATVACLALGALAGCVSLKRTPEARFFALRPVAEPPRAESPPTPTAEGGASIVGVLPVLLPGHLERPQFVTWSGPGEVRFDEFPRWAEPLGSGVLRVLAEDLETLLPFHRVVRAPWPGSTTLRCRVRVESSASAPSRAGGVALRPLRPPARVQRAAARHPRRRSAARPRARSELTGTGHRDHERPPRRPGRTDRGGPRHVAASSSHRRPGGGPVKTKFDLPGIKRLLLRGQGHGLTGRITRFSTGALRPPPERRRPRVAHPGGLPRAGHSLRRPGHWDRRRLARIVHERDYRDGEYIVRGGETRRARCSSCGEVWSTS